jgi:hypothetical protein
MAHALAARHAKEELIATLAADRGLSHRFADLAALAAAPA